ncbi:hypothetical protein Thpro_022573 [Acidihalobacter prosperus]|uniref:Uncharacterized protein n=1 Tax=Acidihalobacter prosperus TaxID=160660 RepID=A0A1A6C190_9GAMM|nr:hypothetical protein Thpro_022573 [Acidihalobacter prosperus]
MIPLAAHGNSARAAAVAMRVRGLAVTGMVRGEAVAGRG